MDKTARKVGQVQDWGPVREQERRLLIVPEQGLGRTPLRHPKRLPLENPERVPVRKQKRRLLRHQDRVQLKAQVLNRDRALLRLDERVLVRGLVNGQERGLLQTQKRLLLQVPAQRSHKGQELPLLSRGWSMQADEVRCQRLDARSQKCGIG